MKRSILPYNPRLKDYARFLRRNATLAEVLLWKRLKGRSLAGFDFDRQRPIGEYIVDFYCKELHLAIEVDGRSHNDKQIEDQERQAALEKLGVRFLRFWDSDVKNDVGSVVAAVENWIRVNAPTPGPSEEGSRPTPSPSEEGSRPTPGPSREGSRECNDQRSSPPWRG